jgi:hypothetical protein
MRYSRSGSSAPHGRRGIVIILSAFMVCILLFGAALVVDHGFLIVSKSRLQNAADSAAFAGLDVLMNPQRLIDSSEANRIVDEAQAEVIRILQENWPSDCTFDPGTDCEIQIGRLDQGTAVTTCAAMDCNAVSVSIRTTDTPLFFAGALNYQRSLVTAKCIASFQDTITEIRPSSSQNAPVLPIAVSVEVWEDVMNGEGPDEFEWDAQDDAVRRGTDSLPECQAFTGSRNAPGNFATLNIGRTSNGIPTLTDQIRNGLSQQHLAGFGGKLQLNPQTQSLQLSGDPGLGGPVYDAVADLIGQVRLIPLFRSVSGSGANAKYEIVGFAAGRIISAKKTGSDKHVTFQPATLADSTVITGPGGTRSYGIVSSPRLAL